MKARGHEPAKVQYWSRHIEMWKSSGLLQKDYCAKRGLGLKSFGRWKRILKMQTTAVPPPSPVKATSATRELIPVSVVPDAPVCHAPEGGQENPAGIRIQAGGYTIDLSVGFHAGTLRTLLDTLEAT